MSFRIEQEHYDDGTERIEPTIDLTEFTPAVKELSFTATKLIDGQILPVASSLFTGEARSFAVVDTQRRADEIAAKVDTTSAETLASTLESTMDLKGKISPDLLARLILVHQAIAAQKLTSNPNRSKLRNKYWKAGHARSIDSVLALKAGKCIEISVLAQQTLQACGIQSRYVSGGMSEGRGGTEPFLTGHGFLLLKDDGREVIYDPYNSMSWGQAGEEVYAPAAFSVDGDFVEQLRNGRKTAVRAHGITLSDDRYYGMQSEVQVIDAG